MTIQMERRTPVGLEGVLLPVLGMALVTALGAQLSVRLPFTPVPLTGQVFGVLLSGLLLSPMGAFTAQMAYLAGAVLGLPWLAGGVAWSWAGGFLTLGYLVAFPLAAAGVAALRDRGGPHLACLVGIAVIHLAGVAWMTGISGLPFGRGMVIGSLPFWPGDIAKTMLAIAVARRWGLVTGSAS